MRSLKKSKERAPVSRRTSFSRKTTRAIVSVLLVGIAAIGIVYTLGPGRAAAQEEAKQRPAESALRQMEILLKEKESRTREQQKIDSQLLYRLKQRRDPAFAQELKSLAVTVEIDAAGQVVVDIAGKVTPELIDAIKANGGEVVSAFERLGALRAKVRIENLEAIAALPEVRSIRPAEEPDTNRVHAPANPAPLTQRPSRQDRAARIRAQLVRALVEKRRERMPSFSSFGFNKLLPMFIGAQNSEGDLGHRADQVRTLGFDGTGVRIGVLSDSVRFLAASQGTADLPAAVTVLAGQSGIQANNSDTGEGTAMLEIIHDLAPGAQLFFATGFGGPANMANNILALANAPNNCDIIVDDLTYFGEGVFQDDAISQAVNTVTAAGVLYFSSAGNSGNLNDTTSGVWEGDFADGGTLALLAGGRVHDFGGNVISNQLLATGGGTRPVTLKWSDPLGASGNDYDLFILNPAMNAIVASSTNTQDGDDNPIESIANNAMTPVFNANDRIVILRRNGSANRALHLNVNRGRLNIGTAGQTYGHNAAGSAFGVAAVGANTAGGGAFTGGATNPVRTFSSDGPRRMFFNPNGTAITPGNVLFGTNGGQVLQKPDIAAADRVTTTVPGFTTFSGTSAAAPHAAAVAALLLDFDNTLTPAQVRNALTSTALDIEAAGTDRDSGAGIVMALQALSAVSSANLAISISDSPDPVIAGTNLTYTINLQNTGTGPAVFAQMNDTLPANTTLQSVSGSAGWNCTSAGNAVTCRKDTMANGESAAFTVVARVNPAAPDGSMLTNTATASSTTADPNNANNAATATTQVIASADIEVLSKVDTPDPVVTNSPLTYTITLRNIGPSVAAGIVLSDPLPAGAIFGSCASTGTGACGGSAQNRNVMFATMAVGETQTVTFVTTANCSLADGAVINNTATVTSATQDPNPGNNSASASTVAQNPPPVITCPADFDVIATTPGSTTATVIFPDPAVVDNCPGAIVACTPASGSAFSLGTTTVNCTATDSGGATASCSFNVTVWDASIQDDVKRDYILFNTFTGEYKFVVCGVDGFVMRGQGTIRRQGCITELRDDTRVISASFDRCLIAPLNSGTAAMKRRQPDINFWLNDRNILNNSPTCP